MEFREADRRYVNLKQQYDKGDLSAEEFESQLEQIMVQDAEDRWWSKHPETGAWYYYDGTDWVEGTPPGYEVPSYPTSDTPPTDTIPESSRSHFINRNEGEQHAVDSRTRIYEMSSSKRLLAAALTPGKRILAAALTPGKRLLVGTLIAAALIGIGSAIAVAIDEDSGTLTGFAPPTVAIVSDLPLQGAARVESESAVNAITLALEERGYMAGDVPVEYRSWDDATEQAGKWDEAKCAENAQSAARDGDIVGWIGPFNSGCAKEQIATLNQAGLAMVSPNNTYVGLTKPGGESDEPEKYYPTGDRNYARVILADDKQGRAGAHWMKQSGVERVYILDDQEVYGKGLADQFQKYAKEEGIQVLEHESIDRNATNYRSLMQRIAQEKPDAIYFGGVTENGAGQLVKDKIWAGMSNGDVIFMSADGLYDTKFLEIAGDAAEGVYLTFPGIATQWLPDRGQEFVERYQERFPDYKVEAFDPYAYEAANVLLDAIGRAYENDGEVTREGVVRELFATKNYDGVLGTWSFDENGDTDLTQLTGDIVTNGEFGLERDKIDVAKM